MNIFGKLEAFVPLMVAGIYLILILLTPAGFWIIDEGNKFLWGKNFFENGSLAIEDRSENISPHHSAFNPPFSVKSEGGGQLTVFSPLFIILISPLVGIGGLKLALLIPAFSTILSLILIRRLAQRMGLHFSGLTAILLGLASPLLFYSITLWEHSLAIMIGLLSLSVSLESRGRLIPQLGAGMLLAVSSYLRSEMMVFSLLVWIIFLKSEWRVALGGILGGVLVLVLNYLFTSEFIPLQITANYLVRWSDETWDQILLSRLDALYALIFQSSPSLYLSVLVIASVLIFILLPGAFKFILPLMILVLVVVGWFDPTPFIHLPERNSLLYTTPFFFSALILRPQTETEKRLWLFAILSVVIFALATPVYRGIHFGPRIMLSSLPFLAILAGGQLKRAYDAGKIYLMDVLVLLMAVQFIASIWSLSLLEGRRKANISRREIILKQAKSTIITPQWWLQQEIPELYLTKDFYFVESSKELKLMLLDYYQKGVRFFTLLIGESEPSPILSIFASAPPRQIGTFKVTTEYPSMNLVGLNYAIGFDVKGAGELACEMGVFFGQNDDLTNSEKYLRYACQWDSDVAKYHYNLAYCLGKQGKYQEALEELDIASTLKPADDSISRLKEQLEEALSDSAKSIID